MYLSCNTARRALFLFILTLFLPLMGAAVSAQAVVSNQAVYNAVMATDKKATGTKAFYAATNYQPIWVGSNNEARRKALFAALGASGDQGLPTSRYKITELQTALNAARNGVNPGVAELLATQTYLQYAQDLSSGAINPREINKNFSINRPRRSSQKLLEAIAKASPQNFLNTLAPSSNEYKLLLAEKRKLERAMGQAGQYQPIPVRTLKRGSKGKSVVLLRQRLKTLGYGDLGDAPIYDNDLKAAVIKFQRANGLSTDGVAGRGTLGQLNQGPQQKLIKVLVNLERERWMNFPRGKRNVFVNQASYTVYLIDNGRVSFQTRAVIGTRASDRRTPEFYDEMTHMVVNPTWHVPKSIVTAQHVELLNLFD